MMATDAEDRSKWPGYIEDGHPEVFDIRAMPPQPKRRKPGQLSPEEIRQYFEEGYVIVKDFFTKEELEPCLRDFEILVENLAQKLYKGGKIKDLYEESDVYTRLIKLNEEFPGAAVLLHKIGKLPQSLRNLWGNERLLNVVEQVLGPDISGMPNWNLRTKTPYNEELTVPWHQDAGYLDNDAYKTLLATVWIPFLDTNKHNGCMEVIPKGHRTGRVGMHQCCSGGTWYIMIEEEEMKKTLCCSAEDRKLCAIPFGGFLLFNNVIPHRSLENFSNQVRWSIDLRFKKTGLPNGMFGLKPDVEMRSSKDPNMKIDWETFDSIDRTKQQMASVKDIVKVEEDQEFDCSVQGPWMRKWELTHSNIHVKKHQYMERVRAQQEEEKQQQEIKESPARKKRKQED
ncbi:uncharacterized protein LOC110454642 isoform X2 [Mizuhopecten yessoensis]|nr:uncharacterized protein LOC110454642 isoform X1 [Mizuhopecten yessoensis]XP_021359945.1 uncharacterized protein LOC110454642 isoform X2 [Mizuhopecten yessoensis]